MLNRSREEDATKRLETPQPRSKTSSFESINDEGFLPGAIVAERYRIVGLLGKGGMGEVYRAEGITSLQMSLIILTLGPSSDLSGLISENLDGCNTRRFQYGRPR